MIHFSGLFEIENVVLFVFRLECWNYEKVENVHSGEIKNNTADAASYVCGIVAPLGAFPQSGHALQWGLILGPDVVLTEGVRRAGWAAGRHVRSLIFRTMTETQPI